MQNNNKGDQKGPPPQKPANGASAPVPASPPSPTPSPTPPQSAQAAQSPPTPPTPAQPAQPSSPPQSQPAPPSALPPFLSSSSPESVPTLPPVLAPLPVSQIDQAPDTSASSVDRLQHWVETNEQDVMGKSLVIISRRFNCTKWTAFLALSALTAILMMRLPGLAPIVSDIICVGMYSSRATLTAMGHRRMNAVSDWLVYWLLYAAVTTVDFLVVGHPLYFPLKTMFLAYFFWPPLYHVKDLRLQFLDPLAFLLTESKDDELLYVFRNAHPLFLKTFGIDLTGNVTEMEQRVHLIQKRYQYQLFRMPASMAGSESAVMDPTDNTLSNMSMDNTYRPSKRK